MQSVISVRQLEKHFRNCDALAGVSLEVPAGVVFALLGENGAGKSTLIRSLMGFVRPDAGQAQVLGLDCQRASQEIRRRVGYVADAPALYDWMKVEEIGWFASGFYPQGFLLRYNQAIVDFEVPTGRKLKQLSKGQRAKVALALAIAHDPDLLILDEPTSGLDPAVRRQFMESMVDRAALGKTVFLSSHQISEVERVADWVAIMHRGKVRLVQPLEEMKSSIYDVMIQLADADVEPPLPAGEVLTQSRHGRQLRMMVCQWTEADRAAISSGAGVQGIEVRRPTLEDIFMACIKGTPPQAIDAELRAAHS